MTNDETRRHRLNELIAERGSVAALARLLDISSAQVSQWRNASPDSKTGKPRTISDGTARRLETVCGKPRGWMDTPPLKYEPRHDEKAWLTVAMEGSTTAHINDAAINAQAKALSQRANAIAALWMQLPAYRQDEIEQTLREETAGSSAATVVAPAARKAPPPKIKTGSD